MKIIRGIKNVEPVAGRVVAIGIFDGVHLGHRKIIGLASKRAIDLELESAVITFEPHPESVVAKGAPNQLSTLKKKSELIAAEGIDSLIIINFDMKFSRLSPRDFCRTVLSEKVSAREVIVGEDFRFGFKGEGGTKELKGLGRVMGFETRVVPMVKDSSGNRISSSRIRVLIEKGDVGSVKEFLGRPYSLSGRVVKGHGRGIKHGFPTANIAVSEEVALPKDGVYEVTAALDGKEIPGIANLGLAPTFLDNERRLEVHLIDWSGNVYGREMELFFLRWIRGQVQFDSGDDLAERLTKDVASAKKSLSG